MNIIDKGLKFTGLSHTNKPAEVIIHHSAGNGTVEAIHNYHASKGWGGIGYHFYVRKDGSVYKGRPTTAVGCHCKAQGKNRVSIGVCFEGDFEKETMSEAQKQAGKELCQYLKDTHKLTKFAKHKDYANTSCCGKNLPFDEITKGTGTTTASTPASGSVVSPKKYNEWVARLQKTCNELGYSNQKVDGYSGKNTLAGCPVLKKGSKGAVVKLLQEHLTNVYKIDCNGIDGLFGSGMDSAVRKYQANNGLDVDGSVGKKTWSKILGL